jgi:hypothetical protein
MLTFSPSHRLRLFYCRDREGQPQGKDYPFVGIKGQAIRQRYTDMNYNAMDEDGNVKTLPLFGDINVETPKYTFTHPSCLLFATQFAQIVLVVTEKAAFKDMSHKGFVQKDCAFAGHSLGEFSGRIFCPRIDCRCSANIISCRRCLLSGYYNAARRRT